ncbi:placenta-specific gene 8 protein-like [Tigriopus californicus]|uniref:placenta-specific gene 8 protein-like n=1 Tax=Tigriopus californicus TaxID=6832 RepID=UPI0027D9E05C|nr:placenta-specific gene 8 protein-like [Tigriopus californicus]
MSVITVQPSQTYTMGVAQRFPAKKRWHQGIFGCFNNPLICLCGFFCSPCLYCSTVNKLGESGFKYWCLSTFCFCPMGVAARSMARERYQIDDTYANDVVVALTCGTCSLCQIAAEIEHNQRNPGY